MPLFPGQTETISTIPDEKLSSVDQIDLSAFSRALSKKPTYKAYQALLVHRRTLQCLKINVDLMVQKADDGVYKALVNLRKTEQDLANACDSTMSPCPTTPPPIVGQVLQTIVDLQTVYHDEKVSVLIECDSEQSRAQALLHQVKKRVEDVEQVLVKKFGIHAVDDEGNPLDMQNLERVIHLMASIPGNKHL